MRLSCGTGAERQRKAKTTASPEIKIAAKITFRVDHQLLAPAREAGKVRIRDSVDSKSRFNRFKSERSSPALWYRNSGSFSSALSMISWNLVGSSGFLNGTAAGSRLRLAS